MASQNKHRRFFHSKNKEKRINPDYEELNKIELKKIINYLSSIYGIDKNYLNKFILLKKGKDVWMTQKQTKNVLGLGKNLNINSVGMRAIRNAFEKPKLTTNCVIFLNDKITKNYYEMNAKELNEFIHGHEIKMRYNKDFKNYLIMKYNKEVYGVGLITKDVIKSQVPKGRVLKNQLIEED